MSSKQIGEAAEPPVSKACEKCGSTDIHTAYHKAGCSDPACFCAICAYGSHGKRHDEHLHRHCRGCSFDWTDDVLAPALTQTALPSPESVSAGSAGDPDAGTDTRAGRT